MLVSLSGFSIEAQLPGKTEKVNIKADRGSFKQTENLIELFDNVTVTDKKMTITSDKMTIELLTRDLSKKDGQKGQSRKAKTINAVGHVIIKDEKMTAFGDRGKYEVAKKTLYLTGDARIEQRDPKSGNVNIYRGRVIIYNTETKQVDIKGMVADVNKSKEEKPEKEK
jgi:lipopolysaccharide transport protein LptA